MSRLCQLIINFTLKVTVRVRLFFNAFTWLECWLFSSSVLSTLQQITHILMWLVAGIFFCVWLHKMRKKFVVERRSASLVSLIYRCRPWMLTVSWPVKYFAQYTYCCKFFSRAVSKSRGNKLYPLQTDDYKGVRDYCKMDVFSPKYEAFFSFYLFGQDKLILSFLHDHEAMSFLPWCYLGVKRSRWSQC